MSDCLKGLLGRGDITTLYQPIIDLETGAALGYEALARGTHGSALESPVALFAAARTDGCVAELDWACRAAALSGALDAGLGNACTLFVNIEPDTDGDTVPDRYKELIERATGELRIVVEVTEQAIVDRPAELLRLLDWARDRSWGVAIDDIGANPNSLAMMPFLEPDVVKLDLSLVQTRPTPEIGQVVSAVLGQTERTGATVLAEGIETEAHREAAMAMGATLGQGFLLGRPAPLPASIPQPTETIPLKGAVSGRDEVTPFSVVRSARPLRRGPKRLIVDLAHHLEEQALAAREAPVILSTFQQGERLDEASRQRYARLVAQGCFVVVIGPHVSRSPAAGVRSARLPVAHRLNEEWSVILVGPHYSGALVARGTAGDDYDFAVTHDRDLVVEAGRALLRVVGTAEVDHGTARR